MSTLEECIADLSESLESWGVSGWGTILLAEELFIDCDNINTIKRSNLFSPEDFSNRFESLIAEKHSWLNMSGLGVLDKTLIIAIEKPYPNSSSHFSGVPNTSVNLSGPMRCVADKNYNLSTFIKIIE